MSKQIVMGCTVEELEKVGVTNVGCDWSFYLIDNLGIIDRGDLVESVKQWESEGAENIGNDLSRLTKKKEGGYVELDVVVRDGLYKVSGVSSLGCFNIGLSTFLTDCPNIVGFGGILFDGCDEYFDILSDVALGSKTKPRTPLKARFWREG